MGWNINWRAEDDSLAELGLADRRFYLQNYYNEDWANNSMMHITVDGARTWCDHASKVIDKGRYVTPGSGNLKNSRTARLSLSSGTRLGCFYTLPNTTTSEAYGVRPSPPLRRPTPDSGVRRWPSLSQRAIVRNGWCRGQCALRPARGATF